MIVVLPCPAKQMDQHLDKSSGNAVVVGDRQTRCLRCELPQSLLNDATQTEAADFSSPI